jgi:hypothetical protein
LPRNQSEFRFTTVYSKFSKRGIALIISALMLITIAVVAGVSFYIYSTKLLGSLEGANVPETMDNLRIEAYNWQALTPTDTLVVNVRNTGTDVLTMSSAQWFVGGVMQTTVSLSGCPSSLSPGALCVATITVSGMTATAGIVYVVKIVLRDGAIFGASVIAGQVTGQTGVP